MRTIQDEFGPSTSLKTSQGCEVQTEMRTFHGPLGCHKSPYMPNSRDVKKKQCLLLCPPQLWSGRCLILKAGVGLSAPPLASRPHMPAQTSSEPILPLAATQTPSVLLPFDEVSLGQALRSLQTGAGRVHSAPSRQA